MLRRQNGRVRLIRKLAIVQTGINREEMNKVYENATIQHMLGDFTCSLRSHRLLPPSARAVTLWVLSLTAYLSIHQGLTSSSLLYARGHSIIDDLPGFYWDF